MTHELRDRDEDAPTPVTDDAPATLADFLRRHPTPTARVQLVDDDSAETTTITVPSEALKMFMEILDHVKDGTSVSVVPAISELTTQQAADLLGVSRPYLINKVLIPTGPLSFRTVGRHRRIRFSELDEYRREDELRRTAAADAVTGISKDARLDD